MPHPPRHRLFAAVVTLVALLLAGGCSGNIGTTEPSGTAPTGTDGTGRDPGTTEEPSVPAAPEADGVIAQIPARQWQRMVATGVWRPGCPVGRKELRRVEINHHTFDGEVKRGVLVVNRDVARSVVRIFTRLYEAQFPIRKMRPVELYGGDVNASLRDDNTSAYNCRRLSQINAPVLESPHANGRAVDINPWENPWKDLRCDCWIPNRKNRVREPGPGVILKGGVVWRAFRSEGWIWQNIDVPDYMHFDTGYPSQPYREARQRSGEGDQ